MPNNLKDIAKELGLSASTISRVVNGKAYVSPKTRRLVEKALERYNYRPNQVARSLKVNTTNTVGIIVPDIRDYFANVIKGADTVFSELGYSIILADSNEDPKKEDLYLRVLYEKRIDGLILATVSNNHETLKVLMDSGLPVVFIDNLPHFSASVDAVLLDNAKASVMACTHLISQGYTRIAIISGTPDETTAKGRLQGYRDALALHGIDPDERLIKHGEYSYETGYRCMNELLDQRDVADFNAVYATTYKMTCGMIRALKERRIAFPEDISIVGFDFHDENRLFSPSVTTVLQPIDSIGRLVAQRLVGKMKLAAEKKGGPGLDIPQKILLDPTLFVGESSVLRGK